MRRCWIFSWRIGSWIFCGAPIMVVGEKTQESLELLDWNPGGLVSGLGAIIQLLRLPLKLVMAKLSPDGLR